MTDISDRAATQLPSLDESRPFPALQFAAPRRGKPPKHWLDLRPEERVEALRALGQPAFRAKQINRHLFEHFTTEHEQWTDLPAGLRGPLAEQWLAALLQHRV